MARNKDMARCELCGNDYDKSFEIRAGGRTHVFDSFECAIQVIAPECESSAAARLLDTGSRQAVAEFSAVLIALAKAAKRNCEIADSRRVLQTPKFQNLS